MTLDLKKRDGLKPLDAKFLAMIDEHGWSVTKVAPRVGDEGDSFAYSTGLFLRFEQPEIIMFGLSIDFMHRIINSIGNQMRHGVKFVPNRDYGDLLENYPCRFKPVDKSQYEEHTGGSTWFYESYEYPVLQCFWPDEKGYFPWQTECNSTVRNLQPFLFLPVSDDAGRVH